MKRFLPLMTAAVLMLLLLTGCGTQTPEATSAPATEAPTANEAKELVFVTGNGEGTYYRFGTVLAETIAEKTDTKLTVKTSGGARENIEALRDGKAQVALTQSDVVAYAAAGERLFDRKAENIRVIANLYDEQIQIVTLNPKLGSVSDLKGKTVSVGENGSGGYFNALDVLEAYGMTEQDITPVYHSFSDSVEALQNGTIDAAFVVAGAPTAAISKLTASAKVCLISLDEAHIEKLLAASSHYRKATISRRSYGTDTDINTIAVTAVMVAREDVPEEDVYNIVSGIFKNLDVITAQYYIGAELDAEKAAQAVGMPYHPGAEKFFRETEK